MARKTKKKRSRTKKQTSRKPWGGRFTEATNALVEEYTASIQYDWRLFPYDIAGSVAHAAMLGKTGIITQKEARRIITGLKSVLQEIADGKLEFQSEE